MIGALDIVSVSFVGMIAGIFLSVAMILNWQVQKRQPGVALWALAYICGSVGLIFSSLRNSLPDIIALVLANVLLDGFVCLLWIGIRHFLGKTSGGWKVAGALLAAHLCFNLYYVIVAPDVAARISGFSTIHAVLSLLCLSEVVRDMRRAAERVVHVVIALVFLVHSVYNIVRLVVTLTGEPIEDLLTAGAFHRFAFVEGIVLSVGLACCLIIVSNQRLRQMLEEQQQQLEKLALTDSLSGLSNRRHFIEAAAREIDRARRYNRPLALIMLDIDNFKSVNDCYGHQCGDDVIRSMSRILRAGLRDQDIVSRIGGEEFAILLPETSGEMAADVAERLRELHAAARVACASGVTVGCTASFGVTELNPLDASIYDLLPRADKAMYAAKNAGRNCVISANAAVG
ncbi:MAG: GGDEF domain-containing protein [Burkholderiaceae bacterium]|nr:GGDEF domain-containing protein [Burkholderiaceae bacterium]